MAPHYTGNHMRRRPVRINGKWVTAIQADDGEWYVPDEPDAVGDLLDDIKQIVMPIPTTIEKGIRSGQDTIEGNAIGKYILGAIIAYAIYKRGRL